MKRKHAQFNKTFEAPLRYFDIATNLTRTFCLNLIKIYEDPSFKGMNGEGKQIIENDF